MLTFRLVALLPLFSVALASEQTTVDDVLKEPAKYENKAISVTGRIFKVERKVSRIKNEYYTFRIGTEKQFLNVYGKEKLDSTLRNGDLVEATGLYKQVRTYKDTVYKNEVDCTRKLNSTFGVKRL